jgi:hypothetical protein
MYLKDDSSSLDDLSIPGVISMQSKRKQLVLQLLKNQTAHTQMLRNNLTSLNMY